MINRGNARARVFHDAGDYHEFLRLLGVPREPVRLLAYCLMPNHFHLVVWPDEDGVLSRWMQWLTTAHVRRHHERRGTSGRIWQGRYKSFPIQCDRHLLTVMRYVERNPLRAGLVSSAADWPWSSLSDWMSAPGLLTRGPVDRFGDWLSFVNDAETASEVEALRTSVRRGRPFGDAAWVDRMVVELGLESTVRSRGRPSCGESS